MNILNFNEYTKKIEHWDPFEDSSYFFENKEDYYILGPYNNEDLRYLWKFNIHYKKNNEIILNSIENSKDFDSCINIFIKNKVGKINYINQCGDYKGSELISWSIEIIKKLGCNKCILIDQAEKKCNKRNFLNYVPLSLIHKLWKNKTYYEKFQFTPYNKNNNSYKNNKIDELNENIKKLQKLKWDEFNIDDEKWIFFKNNYYLIYPSPFLAFKEFIPKNCSIFYDILYLLDNYNQPCYEILQIVKNIITKSIWVKNL